MFVEMGNRNPKGIDRPSITEWHLSGATPEDAGWTVRECITSIAADWANHSNDPLPVWVAGDNEELVTAVGAYFAAPVGRPDNVDGFLTRENAPEGITL